MAQSWTLIFDRGELVPCESGNPDPLVADSFYVSDGHAVAVDRHLSRFSHSLSREAGMGAESVNAFLDRALSAIPSEGEWFPRLECVEQDGENKLRVLLRTAPERSSEVILARAPFDPRTRPEVKGPDLRALGDLRATVTAQGAGEALLLDDNDVVIEGAWSSVVVWDDSNDSLRVVPPSIPRIPSVTESVVNDIAHSLGTRVWPVKTTLADLEGTEVWILSALHGIRLAKSIQGGPRLGHTPGRVETYRDAWWTMRAKLSDHSR